MWKKKIFCCTFLFVIILWIILDFCISDRLYSVSENRLLEQKPSFSKERFIEEAFQQDYEKYLEDQFPFRDQWVYTKTRFDILFGKREMKGVYLAEDGSLIEQHLPSEIDYKVAEKKLYELNELIELCQYNAQEKKIRTDIKIMLVPTADIIYQEKLPPYAVYFDQSSYLNRAVEILGNEYLIDVKNTLSEHSGEYLYYKTDHHWTTQGAFYGYQQWYDKVMETESVSDEQINAAKYDRQTVSTDFYGSLTRKTQIYGVPDDIILYRVPGDDQVKVIYDGVWEAGQGIYDFSAVSSARDQYSVFMGGNHGLVEIETGYENGRTMLLIKDSFANCFVPFLLQDFEKIVVVDPRHYLGNIKKLIQDENFSHVLVLYHVIQFINS